MSKNNETNTKFKVDISELVKGMQTAKRQIALANAEFKKATAGMDDWSASADGVSAKLEQLSKTAESQDKILSALEKQYELTAKQMGADSKEAENLKIKIENQKASITKTQKEIEKYNIALTDLKTDSSKTEGAVDKLSKTISDQESRLDTLKKAYTNAMLEFGASSKEAKELAGKIKNLSSELADNKNKMNDLEGAADKLDKSLVDIDNSAEKAKGGFTIMKGAISDLVADGFQFLMNAVKDTMQTVAFETEQACNSFQMQTGMAVEKMGEFKGVIEEIYKGSFGDSLKDIADVMALIKQNTGETDPTKLKKLTENAIVLRDVFGMDISESIRGVNGLVVNMGVEADTAFDLIVKAAQKGLNKTGELGDNLAEYTQIWGQSQFAAEEMFAVLENGLGAGAYNLDKVNDFVKEFAISLNDGRIEESITRFSKNTQELFEEYKNGKATAKDVFNSVINDLKNTENEQEALTTASTVWSAVGEDNAMKVIKSLTEVNNTYKDVENSMEDVKKVKYDDVVNQYKSIKRSIELDFIAPLAQKAMPTIKKFANYCTNNIDKVIKIVELAGKTIATAFAVKKISDFIGFIGDTYDAFKKLKGAIDLAAKSQELLNWVQNLSPTTILIGAITGAAGLIAAMCLLGDASDDVREKYSQLNESEQEHKDIVDELVKSYAEVKTAREEAVNNVQAEYGYYQQLNDELSTLVDENGKVKEGYEDRANFIITTLNEALGSELEITDDIIENYHQEKAAIDELIKSKKAQAILQASEQEYLNAINKQTEAFKALSDAQADLKVTNEELKEAQEEYIKIKDKSLEQYAEEQGLIGLSTHEILQSYNRALDTAGDKVAGLTEKQEKQNTTVEECQNAWIGYNSTIKNYEGLSSAIISGDIEKIEGSLDNLVNSFISAENGNKTSLENQVANMRKNYEELKKAIDEGTPGVTQKMVDSAREMVNKSVEELSKFSSQSEAAGIQGAKAYADGMGGQKDVVFKFAKQLAKEGVSGLESVKTEDSGTNFVNGFTRGINRKANDGSLFSIVTSLGKQALSWLNKALDEHSPSRLTAKSGEFFVEGLVNGISKRMPAVKKVVSEVAAVAMGELNNLSGTLPLSGNIDFTEGIENVSARIKRNNTSVASGSSTIVNNYEFNQTNTSPKALSRLEIYRQTKNQLSFAKGV